MNTKERIEESARLVEEAENLGEVWGVPNPGHDIGAAMNRRRKKKPVPKLVSRYVATEADAKKVVDLINKGAGKKVASYKKKHGKWLVEARGVRLSVLMYAMMDAEVKTVRP